MNERTPLLRVVSKRQTNVRRYAIVLLVGFVLYCVYLILFLPRTSYQRDWNHLHGNKYTRQEIERAIIQDTSNNTIYEYAQSYYLSGPHLAGSNPALAEWTRAKFEDFGLLTSEKLYETNVSRPIDASIRIFGGYGTTIDLNLQEQPLELDPPTELKERIAAFYPYSGNGTVRGHLVYGKYGRERDFEELANEGKSVRGKIVVLRTSKVPLPTKLKSCKRRGAAAVLVYHDDDDDGKYTAENGYEPYPLGPARNPSSVERETALDYLVQPGYVNYEDKQIIALPISLDNARLLLDDHFYDEVEVSNHVSFEPASLVNVFGTIPGQTREQVIIGNHRDALVIGAADGNSGSAIMMELARVLGAKYKKGWKPYRSIVFASWDGGRYGMLGSTAWAEENHHKLRKRTAAYLDLGVGYSGPEFVAKASPLVRSLIRDCAARVPSPDPLRKEDETLEDYWVAGPHGHAHVGTLASGDFSAFYNFLGITSLSASFRANASSPVYHAGSNYDTLNWQRQYGDTHYEGHLALARLYGLMVERLVSTPVLPLRATEFGRLLQRHALEMLGEERGQEIEKFLATVAEFLVAAVERDAYLNNLEAEYIQDYAWYKFWKKLKLGVQMRVANLALLGLEDQALYRPGLNGRPWFRHVLIAPSQDTGLTTVFPGIKESLSHSEEELIYWLGALTTVLKRMIDVLT